ncbi:MAG: hypothetical protein M1378_13570 [Bacteroidetes bacterium]|nr:hypothetical protein [Bacteroidota bacterium]
MKSSRDYYSKCVLILSVLLWIAGNAFPQTEKVLRKESSIIAGPPFPNAFSTNANEQEILPEDTARISIPQIHDIGIGGRSKSKAVSESQTKSKDSVYVADTLGANSQQADSTVEQQAKETGALLPPAAYDPTSMSFKDADIRDIFRALGLEHGLNIFVDNSVNKRVTISLTRVPLHEAIKFLCEQNSLNLVVEGGIYKIAPAPLPVVAKEIPKPPEVTYERGRISLDVKGQDLALVISGIQEKTHKNILITSGTTGNVNGRLIDIDFDLGFIQLMNNNGFAVHRKNDVYVVTQVETYIGPQGQNVAPQRAGPYWVSVKDSSVTLDVTNAPLDRVISDALRQVNADIVFYGPVVGAITVRATNIPLNRMLDIVLRNTNYAYKENDGVYFVGEKTNKSLLASRLFKLKYLRADRLNEMLPKSVTEQATVKVVKEQNGIIVVGSNDVETQLEEFIRQVDKPVAQVLIEAIVVDYDLSNRRDFGVKAGLRSPTDTTVQGSETILPGMNLFMGAKAANEGLDIIGKEIGVANLGRLPDNFYLNLQAMEQKGLANVRSRPLLATLNGSPASLSIGTTQYFILKTTVPYVNPTQTLFQESDQFQTIQADTKLDIVPYVGSEGLITVDLKPDFKTPVGELSPNVPPTINQRSMSSTVIMREGETIVLGGLIQETESEDRTQIPILGDIPLLGSLFSSTSRTKHKSELIIYVTPHISYGEAFQNMDLPNPRGDK